MNVEVSIASTNDDGRVFLTWTPVQCTARLIDGSGVGSAVSVTLRNSAGSVGQLVFDTVRSHHGTPTLQLSLPGDGSPVRFWIAGQFQKPSLDFGDVKLEVVDDSSAAVLSSTPMMVRVRKNAQTLSATERDRFLNAFGILNGQGAGRFSEFRDMHVSSTLGESHNNWGFLPWHRSYLLDLERELQSIDARVALPYWRFDQPAPQLFTRDFMGIPNANDRVQFTPGHPFQQWTTEGQTGIIRRQRFPVSTRPPGLKTESQTLAFGNGVFDAFGEPFVGTAAGGIELNPHGGAHTSFGFGWIISPPSAPRDPMFFLLHCNVDRLWAKWQWFFKRSSDTDPNAYHLRQPPVRVGHNIGDTMWPWNGVTGNPRPSTAPGGTLAASALTSAPGPSPRVRSMLDYQAVLGGAHLGFDYDDVPFEIPQPAIT